MKIALVHDYLLDYGGAERVLETLHEIYPKAPIYTLIVDKKAMGHFWQNFSDAKIVISWFNRLPFASRIISPLRFLLPLLWSGFDFSDYDVVIGSASWAVTKGFRKGPKTIEICYLHTPPRWLYGYDTSRNWKKLWFAKLIKIYAVIIGGFMRWYDFHQAQKVDYFIANSKNVGKRIEKLYKRTDYQVIYPPCDVEEILTSKAKNRDGNYFLAGGRMIASKNFDLIIKACLKASVNLVIFGTGLFEKELKELGRDSVKFLGRVTDEEVIGLYKGAKAFILAQTDEDFGITSVEAMAAGCPCIAYKGGGYLETVIDGKTGLFFDELTVDSLTRVIKEFKENKPNSITKENCITQAKKFSKERFENSIRQFVKSKYEYK